MAYDEKSSDSEVLAVTGTRRVEGSTDVSSAYAAAGGMSGYGDMYTPATSPPEEAQDLSFIDYQSLPEFSNDCELTEAEAPVEEEEVCPTCVPNPAAALTDWTKTTELEPFLNERKCTYSICITTKYEGTGGIGALQPRLDEYARIGAIKLLAHFNKALDSNTIAAAVDMAGATDHFIPPRARLKMKVLIELPANEFDRLPSGNLAPEVDESVAELEQELGLTAATQMSSIDFEDFDNQMDKLEEGLKGYAKFQAIFYQTQKGAVRFPGGAPVNLQTECDNLRKVRPKLYEFLRTKGWVMRNERGKSAMSRPGGKGLKECERLEFGFTEDNKISQITLYPHGTCADSPTVIKGMGVYTLSNSFPFNRPTTVNWLKNIDDSTRALEQRQGMMKWTEFVEKFVYPTPTVHQGVDIGSTVAAIASASTGTATAKDIEIIEKSAVKMGDLDKIQAQTPGSWKSWPGVKGASGAFSKQMSGRESDSDSFVEHFTTPADREVPLSSGALAEAERRAEEWPYKSNDPNSPTYRHPQEIYDPTLNNGQGGKRMETNAEALDRSNAALAAENAHLTTSSDVIEDLCDGFNLGDALNDLGEDFMNELFSIWDAIAYQFHNFICMTPEQRAQMLENMKEANADAQAAAIREATKILVGFLEMINSLRYSLDGINDIKALYPKALDEITFCGLFDLMSAFIECLAQGFSLEELLEPLIQAALAAMPPMELEKLFVGLPPEDQQAIMDKVMATVGRHDFPWQARLGPPGPDGKPTRIKDPSAVTPFGGKPMAGGAGRSAVIGKGGMAMEKGAARQDNTAVTPKLQGIVRRIEGNIKSAQQEILAEREAEAQALRDAYAADPDTGMQYAKATEPTQNESIQRALLIPSTAGELITYFKQYEIDSSEAPHNPSHEPTAHEIAENPAAYVEAVQNLLDRVNSADTVTTSTVVKDDPFPDKSQKWKALYYEEYPRAYKRREKDIEDIYLPEEDPDGSFLASLQEAAAEHADATAQEYANEMEDADQGFIGDPGPFGTRGSLGAAVGDTVTTLLVEYVKAIIEYYRDKGWDALLEQLDKFPGAQIIKTIIALLDCALPPLFDPPLLDFLNTLQIDFCNMVARIVLPEMPALQMPNWKDFFKFILMLAKEIAIYIAFRLLIWLLTKIVMMLFDSLCSALEKLAEAATNALKDAACQALTDVGGGAVAEAYEESGFCESPPRNMLDLMKEAFCGPNATDEQAQQAANQTMKNMGAVTEADAAKMANEDAATQFVADVSAVLTGNELSNLLLGIDDPVAAKMVEEIVRSENPDFLPALGSPEQISEMFKNIGNLLPFDLKQQMRAGLDALPAVRPANPFLCSTPDEIERFKAVRRDILTNKDGTTAEQADQQFDAMRGRALNDITEMASIMQNGVDGFLADNFPPMIGAPDENGCIPPNAIIPRDPDMMMELVGATNEQLFDIVGKAYSRDIIGNTGCLSMVLSDTNGVPWRRHQRKTRRSMFYSDYQAEILDQMGIDSSNIPEPFQPAVARETGYYPKYVGKYFQDYLRGNKHNPDGYVTTTEFIPGEIREFNWSDLVGTIIEEGSFPRSSTGEMLGTADNPFYTPGYKLADLTLKFRDNNKGIHPDFLPEEARFSEGFDIEYSSYTTDEDGNAITDDVYELRIMDVENVLPFTPKNPADMLLSIGEVLGDIDPQTLEDGIAEEKFTLRIRGDLSEGANELKDQYDLSSLNLSPQANLWNDYIFSKYVELGTTESDETVFKNSQPFLGQSSGSATFDKVMDTLLDYFGKSLANNQASYLFGFNPEEDADLKPVDKLYMGPEGYENKTFKQYVWEDLSQQLGDDYIIKIGTMEIPNMKKIRKYIRDNQIMGTSNHERMHFLSPAEFGGSWMKPPYYMEPPTSEGWIGVRDALLPEVDGKDPKRVPVCNFQDIKERVDQLTKKMPDDPRLSECPDCVVELPYSRILDRASAAGLEGPIVAMIRIYVVEEMLKAMPLFSKFKARIPEVMDYAYVEYILANMKEDFTTRLGRKRGFLKGDALWYTFLEQCVQSFCRQIQLDGREVSRETQEAIDALNSVQETFVYPTEEKYEMARRKGGFNPWAQFGLEDMHVAEMEPEIVFDRKVTMRTKLAWYRRWHLLQAVKDSEQHANVIVRVMIEEQLEYIAERFSEALAVQDMAPDITNIYEFFIGESGFVAGTQNYSLSDNTKTPMIFDVASAYTEDILQGYYSHPLNQYQRDDVENLDVSVVLNDDDRMTVRSYQSRFTSGEFILEKYIYVIDKNQMGLPDVLPEAITDRPDSINGVVSIQDWKDWLNSVSDELGDRKLSEFFGDLRFTYAADQDGNPTDEITGMTGEMGVRYGLRLSYIPPEECAEDLEAFISTLRESENSSLITKNAEHQKAFMLMSPQLNINRGINITSVKVVDARGVELPILTEQQRAIVDSLLEGNERTGMSSYTIPGSKALVPLVSAEYDALDHTISQHINYIDTDMDLHCLGKDLIAKPEFELLFQYVFPLNRLTSIMGIYTGMGFFKSIGEKTLEVDFNDLAAILQGGYPTPNQEAGEWQNYSFRKMLSRGGRSYDRWDPESLFPKTKRRLVKMFRSYFKSREWLSHKDDEENTESEKSRKSSRDEISGKKNGKGKRGGRSWRRRRRDRPYDKFGN